MNLMSDHLKGADSYWQGLIDRVRTPGAVEPVCDAQGRVIGDCMNNFFFDFKTQNVFKLMML